MFRYWFRVFTLLEGGCCTQVGLAEFCEVDCLAAFDCGTLLEGAATFWLNWMFWFVMSLIIWLSFACAFYEWYEF